VLLHDAARPFVSQQIIADVCQALESHPAVSVAVPVTDTLYLMNDNTVKQIPSRSEYMRAQTPQAFHLETIEEAYRRALESGNIIATDDAGIVHKYMPEQPIFIVRGDEANKKITYKEDL
jgi:2-C-methyl-D-erythritol 4-phosphate cytidylyltransferase